MCIGDQPCWELPADFEVGQEAFEEHIQSMLEKAYGNE